MTSHVGDRVEVRGLMNGTSLVASEIKVEDRDRDDEGNEAEIKGVVSALTGSCPTLTFTVDTTRVVTNGSTEFRGIACTAIVNGARVDAQGARQADGSIIAAKVDIDVDDDDDDD